jgi:pectin methylesterase-like acyl-CoA thioesterase
MRKWTATSKFYISALEDQATTPAVAKIAAGEVLYESPAEEQNLLLVKGVWYTVTFPDSWKANCTDDGAVSEVDAAALLADNTYAGTASAVSDEAYGADWDGVPNMSPSKNALFDKIEAVEARAMNDLDAPDGPVDIGGQRLTDVGAPSEGTDAATKEYADGIASGIQPKLECRCASLTNITNLDFRTTQLDSVTYTDLDRLLVKNQDDKKENGIYVGSTTGAWVRATDADSDAELVGAFTFVLEGSQANSGWVVAGEPVLGVDDIVFTRFSQSGQIEAGNGLSKLGNTMSAVGAAGKISVGADGIDIDPAYPGQESITDLGTVTTGKWNADPVEVAYGGTGGATQQAALQNLGVIFSDIVDVIAAQTIDNSFRGQMLNTNATSGSIDHQLPLSSEVGSGFVISFRKSDATTNTVNALRSGSNTINGATSASLTYQNQTMTLVADGVSAWIIAQRGQRNPTPIGEGGTGANLAATGGASQYVKQLTVGGNMSVGAIAAADLPTGIDAANLADGSVSNAELQYIGTLTSNAQTQLNAKIEASNALLSVHNVLMVKKNPGTGEYSTIAAAIAAINTAGDAADDHRYVIYVGPGTYTEALLTIPSYTYVVGSSQEAVKVEPNAANHHVFVLSSLSGLSFLTITGAGTGYSGIYANNVGDFALVHKCSIVECDIGVTNTASTINSFLYLEYVDFLDCTTHSVLVQSSGAETFLSGENLFVQYALANPTDAVLISGADTEVTITSCQMMGLDETGNAFRISEGGYLNFAAGRTEHWGRAFYVDATGSSPYLKVQGTDLDDNVQDIYVNNSTCTGFYDGYYEGSKIVVHGDAPFFVANQDGQIITVSKKGGNFTSVKDAVDSISDSSTSKRYVIFVGPGTFSERTITMKPYVYIAGTTGKLATIIEQNASDTNLIQTSVNCAIINCFLRGRSTVNTATIRYTGDRFRLIDTRIGTAKLAIDAQNVSGTGNSLWITRCSIANGVTIGDFIKVSDAGEVIDVFLEGLNFLDAGGLTNFATISGANTKVYIMNCLVRMASIDATGYGIKISGGADLRMFSTALGRYDTALYVPNDGDGPNITINSCVFRLNTTYDINLLHTGATGTISATCLRSKTVVSDGCQVGLQIQDTDDGSLTIAGDVYIGKTFNTAENYSEALQKSQPIGATYGGALTSTGLVVTAAAGQGYLMKGTEPDNYAAYVVWEEDTTTVPANTDSYIYIDGAGDLKNAASRPNIFTTIILGKVRTSASAVLFFQDIEVEADSCELKMERTMRLGLGPLFASGSAVTENTTKFHLDAASGVYYYGTHEYAPSGGADIAFTTWRRNNAGGWVTATGVQVVDKLYYDNAGASLTAITAGWYAKHSFYIVNDGGHESYHLVYAQAIYATPLEAQNAAIATPPGTWSANITRIATIIVKQDGTAITEIRDERPRLGFTASAVSVVTLHGDLTGRDADDHQQYLLVNGNRAMSGDLDMDNNDLTNVGVINGIDIAAHGAQHDANGDDPLTTGAPDTSLDVSSTNAEGDANALARADH